MFRQDFVKKDSRITARKQLKLSSLKFENETRVNFERKMASSPARKKLIVFINLKNKRWPHYSKITTYLSSLKFWNDTSGVHHFKREVASLLAKKKFKLKLGSQNLKV